MHGVTGHVFEDRPGRRGLRTFERQEQVGCITDTGSDTVRLYVLRDRRYALAIERVSRRRVCLRMVLIKSQ